MSLGPRPSCRYLYVLLNGTALSAHAWRGHQNLWGFYILLLHCRSTTGHTINSLLNWYAPCYCGLTWYECNWLSITYRKAKIWIFIWFWSPISWLRCGYKTVTWIGEWGNLVMNNFAESWGITHVTVKSVIAEWDGTMTYYMYVFSVPTQAIMWHTSQMLIMPANLFLKETTHGLESQGISTELVVLVNQCTLLGCP